MLIWHRDNYTTHSSEATVRNDNSVDRYRLWWACLMRENGKGMVT